MSDWERVGSFDVYRRKRDNSWVGGLILLGIVLFALAACGG